MKKAAAAKRGAKRVATVDNDKSKQPSKKIAKGIPKNSNDDNHAVLSALTARELRHDLKNRGLTMSGTKDELIQRLLSHLTSNSEKEPEGPSNEDEEQPEPNPPLPLRSPSPINNFNDDWDRDHSNIVKGEEIDINPYHPDVDELQQKVTELENQLQLANQAAQEAELARQYAETCLDNKPIVIQSESQLQTIQELENSLADLKAQFEEAIRKLEEANNINKELKQENDLLSNDRSVHSGSQGDSIADLQKKLADAMKREDRAYKNNAELSREKGELSNQVADFQRSIDTLNKRNRLLLERVNLLTRQLDENDDLARIGHVPHRNIKEEDEKPPRMQQLQKGEVITIADDNRSVIEEQPNDLQMRLLISQFEESRRKEEDAMSKIEELVKENSSLKEELDEARRNMQDAATEKDDLEAENCALKNQLDELRRKMQYMAVEQGKLMLANSSLEKQLEESKKEAENSKINAAGLELMISALKKQLEEAIRPVENAKNSAVELTDRKGKFKEELNETRKEMQDKSTQKDEHGDISFRKELDEIRRQARDVDIENEMIGFMSNKQLQERVNTLTHQLNNAQHCGNVDRTRIDHLMHRLAQYEGSRAYFTH